jgi:hypothetical protein
MIKNIILLLIVTVLTGLVSIGIIRWQAPGLLGIPTDLQLVRVSKTIPPFYDNVFRKEDFESEKFILNDPITIQRAKPLYSDVLTMGPNDILGFRNREVPNRADIITIGDSQTYGNNAILEYNWPNRLKSYLADNVPSRVYNMSCGAWHGPQYLDMFQKALYFEPRVIVVAFYTGNDPIGAFKFVYGNDHFKDLRPVENISSKEKPQDYWPPKREDYWPVTFYDGSRTIFTAKVRLFSNMRTSKAVQTGWDILVEIANRMNKIAEKQKIGLVFTIIPTKELVYAERVRKERLLPPSDYKELVTAEKQNIQEMASILEKMTPALYVDLLKPMQLAAMNNMLYPPNADGHPSYYGYDIIAKALAPAVEKFLSPVNEGLVYSKLANGQTIPLLVQDKTYYLFSSMNILARNGWNINEKYFTISERDMMSLTFQGIISKIDPKLYGPEAIR